MNFEHRFSAILSQKNAFFRLLKPFSKLPFFQFFTNFYSRFSSGKLVFSPVFDSITFSGIQNKKAFSFKLFGPEFFKFSEKYDGFVIDFIHIL